MALEVLVKLKWAEKELFRGAIFEFVRIYKCKRLNCLIINAKSGAINFPKIINKMKKFT
jgi:hypothetical protein